MKKLYLLCLIISSLNADCFRFSADALGAYRWDCAVMQNPAMRDERPIVDTARFDNLGIWEVGGRGRVDGPYQFFALVDGRYGWVTCGDFQVKERFKDGIQELDFFAKRDKVGGNVSEVYGVVGYDFCFCFGKFQFSPEVGYAYYHNEYCVKDGVWGPTSDFEEFPDPFEGELKNHSRGVLFGFSAGYTPFSCVNLYTTFYYNWLCYHARGNGHVGFSTSSGLQVSGSQDFTNEAHMRGPIVKVGVDAFLFCNFYAGLQFVYRHFCTRCGTEELTITSKTVFNGAILEMSEMEECLELDHLKWDTKRIELHLGWCF